MTHYRLIRLLYVLITIALCMQLVLSGWNLVSGISNNPTGWTLTGIFLYPLTILLIFYFLRGIMGSLNKMEIFAYANIRRLRYIGYCYLGYSLFSIIKDFILSNQHHLFTNKPDSALLIIDEATHIFRQIPDTVLYGLILLIVAEVLDYMPVLKREQDPMVEPAATRNQ